MTPEPFEPHRAQDLELSTAIPALMPDAVAESAGHRAAEMLEAIVAHADVVPASPVSQPLEGQPSRGHSDADHAVPDVPLAGASGPGDRPAPAAALLELQSLVAQATRANMSAAADYWTAVTRVASFSELLALNASQARKQMDASSEQARTLARVTRDLSTGALAFLGGSLSRT